MGNTYPSTQEVYKVSNTTNLTDYNAQQNQIMNMKMENPQLKSTQKSFKKKQLNIRQISFIVLKTLSILLPLNAPHQTMGNDSPNNNISMLTKTTLLRG